LLRKPRDARLDFWRGLCLIDMVFVHLLVQGLEIGHFPHAIFGDYTRFAAGGFIFVAGMGVGRIFLPKANDPAKRVGTYLSLLRRALYILAIHYTATLGFMIFAMLRGEPLPPVTVLATDILLLREGYDLLPFYVVMIALSPLFLELIRRGRAAGLAIASLGVFLWGRDHHYVESIPIQQTFFVVLWQAVFVMGLLAGAAFPMYDALQQRTKIAMAGVATAATLVLTAMAYGWHFGVLPKFDALWFVKVPLSGGEMLRYLAFIIAIITVTDILWRFIRGSRLETFVGQLGRRSLAMYVAHVFVVGLLVPISYRFHVPLILQLAYFPLAVAMLWGVVRAMDAMRERSKRRDAIVARGRFAWRFQGWPVAATAAVLLVTLGIWAHIKPLPPGVDYDVHMTDEWADADNSDLLDVIGPRFLLPVTPGIFQPQDGLDEAEGTAYAGAARIGRTKDSGVGSSPFRRQL
jgi:hypothetical protein